MGKIIYLMGKSATGKDTIFKRLKENHELNLKTVVLYTTRPIRHGEVDGGDYYFIHDVQADVLESSGKMIEMRAYQTVHGVWKYITMDDQQFADRNANYLMIGTLESYAKVREYFGEERMLPVYITVEDGVRLTRALEREKKQEVPKYAEMCRRFLADEMDFAEKKLAECGIKQSFENERLEDCIAKVTACIKDNIVMNQAL